MFTEEEIWQTIKEHPKGWWLVPIDNNGIETENYHENLVNRGLLEFCCTTSDCYYAYIPTIAAYLEGYVKPD